MVDAQDEDGVPNECDLDGNTRDPKTNRPHLERHTRLANKKQSKHNDMEDTQNNEWISQKQQ